MNLNDCHNFDDFRKLAKKKLPSPIFHYIDGGSDDETTLKRNTGAQCYQKKKPEIIGLMKKIGNKINHEQELNFNSMNIGGVCDEFEISLRKKDFENYDNKRWFYRPFETF